MERNNIIPIVPRRANFSIILITIIIPIVQYAPRVAGFAFSFYPF
jgi:hypothetical protein